MKKLKVTSNKYKISKALRVVNSVELKCRQVFFCSSCGAPMPKVQQTNTEELVRCEGCGAMVKKEARFCTSCGKPMVQLVTSEKVDEPMMVNEKVEDKVCPVCGAKVEDDAAFCTECGNKL